jgi:hypothetical protein
MLFINALLRGGGAAALPVRNTSGSTLVKGTLVFPSGYDAVATA